MINKIKMAYGTDEENLSASGEFETFEEAFQEAIAECDAEVGDVIYVAEINEYTPRISANQILEMLNENAHDKCGEHVDCWPEPTKEQRADFDARINKFINDWLKEIKEEPRFWTCGKPKSFEVTQAHLDGLK
jgi:hypothetical protein